MKKNIMDFIGRKVSVIDYFAVDHSDPVVKEMESIYSNIEWCLPLKPLIMNYNPTRCRVFLEKDGNEYVIKEIVFQ